jgi:hypothetical protein
MKAIRTRVNSTYRYGGTKASIRGVDIGNKHDDTIVRTEKGCLHAV